ncbi:hypothetical protein [Stenotrophomonas sp.]|uniref:hypothetical protein n=1 Tax=Stenotrophomonas sp. TaxID=69392 RepID=UPI0028A8215C|nr:hypothetical protein [Stenotrophomonas sp.]
MTIEKKTDTEVQLWRDADSRQKSFVVQVLHWFHFRPNRLKASWKQEEVLTWELLRAMDVLPHKTFLLPLLERIAEVDPAAGNAVATLLACDEIVITAYPTLGLKGNKINCKSDIGIGTPNAPFIWIEAKTAKFRSADLHAQLRQQQAAMQSMMPNESPLLLTLLPESRAVPGFPNLAWTDVEHLLEDCTERLLSSLDRDSARGYVVIARELQQRIKSHPNRASDWV